MEKKVIRMGVVGTGLIFKRHCAGIMASPDAVLTAMCDTDKATLEEKAREVGVPVENTFTNYIDMLDSGLIDAVLIATPNSTHVEIAMEALKRGLPFAMEKPVGVNVEEVEKLYDAMRGKDVKNIVCLAYRCKASARYAKHIIESGALGEIYHIYTEYYQDYDLRPFSLPTFWRFDKSVAGGGVVYDLGSHMMDLVTFMTGLKFRSVCAINDNVIKQRPDPVTKELREVTTDDYSHMLAQFDSGASGSFLISKCCMGRKNYQRIQIYGSKGALIYSLTDKNLEDTIEVCIGEPYTGSYNFTKLDIPAEYYREQMQSFFDEINGCGDGLTADIGDGLISQRMIERVMESAERREWIDVSDVFEL